MLDECDEQLEEFSRLINDIGDLAFLQDLVYDFKLSKNYDLTKGDYSLIIERHDLKSSELTIKTKTFPIWIFWYKPSDKIINSANNYISKSFQDYSLGVLLYLEESPNIAKSFAEDLRQEEAKLNAELEEEIITESGNSYIWSKQIDNPLISENFYTLAKLLAREIIKPLAEMVK